MATPTQKGPVLTEFMEEKFGRTTAIEGDVCVPEPMGCGGPAVEFNDTLSVREYAISGLCQICQDEVFVSDDDGMCDLCGVGVADVMLDDGFWCCGTCAGER